MTREEREHLTVLLGHLRWRERDDFSRDPLVHALAYEQDPDLRARLLEGIDNIDCGFTGGEHV